MTATSLNKVLEVLDAEADSSSSFSDASMLPQPAKGNEARSARAAMSAHRKVQYCAILSADTYLAIITGLCTACARPSSTGVSTVRLAVSMQLVIHN
jgi:hypothetical protein